MYHTVRLAGTNTVHHHKQQFISLSLDHGVLRFGEFELKSGRLSPYFFNAGQFSNGKALAEVGRHYAQALQSSGLAYDMLFGPAYKGISLATATAVALADHHDRVVPVSFNRKEAKDHGEGGNLIGAPLEGRVIIVDDVITAGTAVRESVQIIAQHDAVPAGVLIAMDRQERGQDVRSAVQQVEQDLGLPVVSIICLDDLIGHLGDTDRVSDLAAVQQYRAEYGV